MDYIQDALTHFLATEVVPYLVVIAGVLANYLLLQAVSWAKRQTKGIALASSVLDSIQSVASKRAEVYFHAKSVELKAKMEAAAENGDVDLLKALKAELHLVEDDIVAEIKEFYPELVGQLKKHEKDVEAAIRRELQGAYERLKKKYSLLNSLPAPKWAKGEATPK